MQIAFTIVALVAAASSAGFAAWQLRYVATQTKALVRQSETTNALVATSEMRGVFGDLRVVYGHLIEYPELRPCFYEGDDGSQLSERQKSQLATLAEMFADTLEVGLFTTERHPSTASLDDWLHYTSHLLMKSPALRLTVLGHIEWWPLLHPYASSVQAGLDTGRQTRSMNRATAPDAGNVPETPEALTG